MIVNSGRRGRRNRMMKLLLNIYQFIYFIGIELVYYSNGISRDTYYICLGIWGGMLVLVNIWNSENGR